MKITFFEWMGRVDAAMIKISGLHSDCIDDFCYRDWYDDGKSPAATAKAALANAGYDRSVTYCR